MSAFTYRSYGLTVQSDLALPELTPTRPGGAIDVTVRIGAVPERLEQPTGRGVLYEANAEAFLLRMAGVARYLVSSGRDIVIEPAEGSTQDDIRVFLVGSCFGALLHQRKMLVLHAAAIRVDRGAALFAGQSGAGKSTLLSAMLERGHPMMVDDVCGVVMADGRPQVLPGYPRTRLWADSAARLDIATDELPRTRPSLEKFERQVPAQFWDTEAPLHCLYVLTSSNEAEIKIDLLPRVDAFSTVLFNTYRRQFVEGLEMGVDHFTLASTVATSTTIKRVVRPAAGFDITGLADMIEADIERS